jgi:hypothetical protein
MHIATACVRVAFSSEDSEDSNRENHPDCDYPSDDAEGYDDDDDDGGGGSDDSGAATRHRGRRSFSPDAVHGSSGGSSDDDRD